jgi:hypothetical protein
MVPRHEKRRGKPLGSDAAIVQSQATVFSSGEADLWRAIADNYGSAIR